MDLNNCIPERERRMLYARGISVALFEGAGLVIKTDGEEGEGNKSMCKLAAIGLRTIVPKKNKLGR
jgi:hypothetical protein